MQQPTALAPHPRLYIGSSELDRVGDTAGHPLLEAAHAHVGAVAEQYLDGTDFEFVMDQHNSLLIRARMMQTRVITLLVRWRQTDDQRYRDAAVAHVRQMDRWQYWSWIAMRQGDDRPEAIFDLSYGENSATLAIAYTLLHDTLSDDEAQAFHDMAARRALGPYLHHVGSDNPPSWFGRPDSNWNSVCTGGAGMLALAMHDVVDAAPAALEASETSIAPFMRALEQSGGAWPEGVGYWNYGMRYAFMYLLSHERATSRPHPLLEQPATRDTLRFPLDFSPHGVACSFGDVNHWSPLPFHYAATHRLGCDELITALDRCVKSEPGHTGSWPNAAEFLLLHPRTHDEPAPRAQQRVLRHYTGQDWCTLADRWPDPSLYVSIRGGTTEVPHGHRDLLSFNVLVNRERLLHNADVAEYLDTTFSPRRQELFEVSPHAKNTLLINGVGIADKTAVETRTIDTDMVKAVRLDGAEAMGVSRSGVRAADKCLRLIALIGDDLLLVIDRVELPHPGRLEARYHTPGTITRTGHTDEHQAGAHQAGAHVAGACEQLHAAFACSEPAALHTAAGALTSPDAVPPLHMLRWCTRALHKRMLMASAWSPAAAPTLELTERDDHITVTITRDGRPQVLRLPTDLVRIDVE